MFKKMITTLTLTVALSALAHEGHDQAPGSLKSSHGGIVKAGHEINLEYIVTGQTIKLFPLSHDGKDILNNDVRMTATFKSPKGKPEVAVIDFKEGSYNTTVDFKGAYRVEMTVTTETKGKKDSFKFQVEK